MPPKRTTRATAPPPETPAKTTTKTIVKAGWTGPKPTKGKYIKGRLGFDPEMQEEYLRKCFLSDTEWLALHRNPKSNSKGTKNTKPKRVLATIPSGPAKWEPIRAAYAGPNYDWSKPALVQGEGESDADFMKRLWVEGQGLGDEEEEAGSSPSTHDESEVGEEEEEDNDNDEEEDNEGDEEDEGDEDDEDDEEDELDEL